MRGNGACPVAHAQAGTSLPSPVGRDMLVASNWAATLGRKPSTSR